MTHKPKPRWLDEYMLNIMGMHAVFTKEGSSYVKKPWTQPPPFWLLLRVTPPAASKN